MLRIAICDDEAEIRSYLSQLIQQTKIDCIIEEYTAAEPLLDAGHSFHIIFLDIRMGQLDGLTAAKQIRQREGGSETILIFVTALEQYVFQAFDVNAFHYLLKPIETEKFDSVFRRAVKECISCQKRHYLFIQTRAMQRALDKEEIYYIESAKRKVIICTKDEKIETYATMNELGPQLGENFFRCHRGFFVNLAMIEAYHKSIIRLKNGAEVLLAKQKYQNFIQVYMQYLRDTAQDPFL